MKVHLHIERLIVDGLPISTAQGALLKAALSSELARLFETQHWNEQLKSESLPQLRGDSFAHRAEDSPRQLGNKIAAAIHGSVQRPR